jgi:hypothetical protein
VRGLVGETALQQIKDGSYDGPLSHSDDRDTSGDETVPLKRSTTGGSAGGPGTLENLNLAMGQLTILPESEGGTLYAGGTAWDAVFAQFAELKNLLKQARDGSGGLPEVPSMMVLPLGDSPVHTQYLPSESFNTGAEDDHPGEPQSCFPFNNCNPPRMPEVIALLPSRNLVRLLVDKFFTSILPFTKIIHGPTFRRELEEFYKNPSEAKPGWVALLFCVIMTAMVSVSPTVFAMMNDTGHSYEQIGKIFQRASQAALVHAQFLRNHTLPVIQCLILMQISMNPEELSGTSAVEDQTNPQFHRGLCMVLQRIWPCKWASIESPRSSKSPNQKRKSVVGSGGVSISKIGNKVNLVQSNSRLSCINHGIAVGFQDHDMDCREPLIINDDQVTADLAEKRHSFPSGTDAPFGQMTLFFCQMCLAKILTNIIQIAFGLKRINYSKILKLDEEVEAFRQKALPRVLVPDAPGYDKNLEPVSMIMRCFYLKAILLLHRPFIGRSKENEQFRWSRDRAVQAALLIARNSIHLFTHSNIILEGHYGAYPMLAHGLFPAPVALALDLYTYPDQPNPEPARQALLEIRRAYLGLCSQFAAMKRLYKIVNVLMAKAWEKAGLSLPAEDVSRIGSFSSLSTPSPVIPQFEETQKWGPQGVVPTSMQQFLPTPNTYQGDYDYSTQQRVGSLQLMPAGTFDAASYEPFQQLGSDTSSSSQFSTTPLFPDMENNINWVWLHLFMLLTSRIKRNGICL